MDAVKEDLKSVGVSEEDARGSEGQTEAGLRLAVSNC